MAWDESSQKHQCWGSVNKKPARMLVDTGCDMTMVSAKWVDPEEVDRQNTVPVLCVHGDTMRYPTASIALKVGKRTQTATVAVAPNLPVPVLLGRDVCSLEPNPEKKSGFMVITRSQKQRENERSRVSTINPEETSTPTGHEEGSTDDQTPVDEQRREEDLAEKLPDESESQEHQEHHEPLDEGQETDEIGEQPEQTTRGELTDVLQATPRELEKWQLEESSLQKIREVANQSGDPGEQRVYFYERDGLVYRSWRPAGTEAGDVHQCKQLVLPEQCRALVLRLAHDVPMAGHLGITKTKDRVLQHYYWPGVFKDVADYCRTCEVCQRSQPRPPGRAELIPMPIISKPFQRIAMDLVGPLPRSQRGNRFILVVCDYATRYPEAFAIPSTEATRIAKELVGLFTRVGVPEEILNDQGANFMSSLLGEVYQVLHIRRIRTTPYHPQTDGLVERFNGTLKAMLKKFVNRSQKNWDEYLPYVLFPYREVPQESTGFSPFELLYGHRVRGPLDVLKEGWTGETESETPIAEYVVTMRDRLQEMTELVQTNLERSQSKQKRHYDRGTRHRSLDPGDQVLVLLSNVHNRLKLEWVGPHKVLRRVTPVDYEVEMSGRRKEKRVYHINLLKQWHTSAPVETPAALLAVLPDQSETQPEEGEEAVENLFPLSAGSMQVPDLTTSSLTEVQRAELQVVFQEFPEVFRLVPGRTSITEHSIYVGDSTPIRQKSYRIPYSQRELVETELDQMLQLEVISPSTSPWASPIVLVTKKDGGVRFCVDYRKLNQVAKFDAYPMPRIKEIFEQIGTAGIISTLDLAKGYWQIPMASESREITAFTTPFGVYEFNVMPFGLHNAPASFQRLINHIIRGCEQFAGVYIDDVVVFSQSWEQHLKHLGEVFSCLRQAGLTLKVAKCQFGLREAKYLGHVIGGGQIKPDPKKVQSIQEYPMLCSKKDVRAFLGLAGYYRRFIPEFASIAAPLTDLTRKGNPDKVVWSTTCETAFQRLKALLQESSILKVAEPNKPFVLQTDASDQGLGAVLSQKGDDGQEHPVAYASRKLFP